MRKVKHRCRVNFRTGVEYFRKEITYLPSTDNTSKAGQWKKWNSLLPNLQSRCCFSSNSESLVYKWRVHDVILIDNNNWRHVSCWIPVGHQLIIFPDLLNLLLYWQCTVFTLRCIDSESEWCGCNMILLLGLQAAEIRQSLRNYTPKLVECNRTVYEELERFDCANNK